MKIKIQPQITLQTSAQTNSPLLDLSRIISLLNRIKEGKSMLAAAQSMEISYRTIWNHLKLAEKELGVTLLDSVKGHGSQLSVAGELLLASHQAIELQLRPLFESLANQFQDQFQALTQPLHPTWQFATSSDPLIEKLISQSTDFELRTMGSSQALESLMAGRADIAGFHILDKQSIQAIYTQLKKKGIDAIPVMRREQGLIVAKGNPYQIQSIRDLARPEVRFINRQKGAGTRLMLDQLLAEQGIPSQQVTGYQHEEFTHSAVATAIVANVADAGLGLQYVAKQFNLDFIALNTETFFLAMPSGIVKNAAITHLTKQIRTLAAKTLGYAQVKLRNKPLTASE